MSLRKRAETLHVVSINVVETLQQTIITVRLRPEFKQIRVTLRHEGATLGWFDFRKLDRAFQNILQNACEAAPPDCGKVDVMAHRVNNDVEIFVTDNGSGVPESLRDQIFQPFMTYGKEGGTGLGLAVVQKIVRDHGGEVRLESSREQGTTFKLTLPVTPAERLLMRTEN